MYALAKYSDGHCGGRDCDGAGDQGTTSQSTTIPADATAFEVASIKPIRPPLPTGGGPWIASRGRLRAEAAKVRTVIAVAYGVLPAQLEKGPRLD
jgi:hypothetical protein